MKFTKLFSCLWLAGSLGLILVIPFASSSATTPNSTHQDQTVRETPGDDLSASLAEARERLLAKDLKGAAAALRRAADLLEADARQAKGDVKRELKASADELRELAAEVEKGAVQSLKKLDQAAARAYWAEAGRRYYQATRSWAQKQSESAGRQLDQATRDLEKGWERSQLKMDELTREAITESRSLTGRIEQGAEWTRAEMNELISSLGRAIDRLGEALERESEAENKTSAAPPEKETKPERCSWQAGGYVLPRDGYPPEIEGLPLPLFTVACVTR